MNLVLVIIIVGFLLNLYDKFKLNNKGKETFNKITLDVIEKNINPEFKDNIKDFIEYNDYEDIDEEIVYLEDEEDEDITVVYNEVYSDCNYGDIKRDINNFKNKTYKKKSKKKNPFALTNNTVTNAIIASEILNKPKCKKKN